MERHEPSKVSQRNDTDRQNRMRFVAEYCKEKSTTPSVTPLDKLGETDLEGHQATHRTMGFKTRAIPIFRSDVNIDSQSHESLKASDCGTRNR